jgi:hypothetical protein
MKIESSVYSRNMINNLPQQRQNQKTEGAVTPQQNTIDKTSQSVNRKSNISSTSQVNGVEFNLNNLPKKLDDVLIPEEKAMLQELFPGSGSRWGVDAYKMSTAISSSNILGKKLDLTT